MTVETQTKKVSADGNDVATVFSFSPIVIFASTDIVVTKVDASDVETVLAEGASATTYSVSVSPFPGTGSITYPAVGGTPLATGESITIKRVLTLEQTLDLENQGGYLPENQEQAHDKHTMVSLQQQEEIDRCVKLADTDDETALDTTLPAGGASKGNFFLGLNAAGTGLQYAQTVSTATTTAFWTAVLDDANLATSLASLGFSTVVQAILVDTTAAAILAELDAPDLSEANTFTGANSFSGVSTFSALVKWAKGADVVAAAALPVLTDGNYFDVTGTTTVTSINTLGIGTIITLHFDAALVLTHHATDLLLPGAANITTAAGDEAMFIEFATGDWRCLSYTKASGEGIVGEVTSLMSAQGDLVRGGASGVPERVALGASGTALVSDGTDAVWGVAPFAPDYISKYTISIDTDTDHDILFPAISCRDEVDSGNLILASMAKQIDSDWVAGDDAGGFPSGLTLAIDTWYHIGIVDKTDGTIDAGFDTSPVFTNLLTDTGGTRYRRLGSVLTDGTSNIVAFTHAGPYWFWNNPPFDVNVTNQGTSALTRTLQVPPDFNVMALLNVAIQHAGDTLHVYFRFPSVDDEASSAAAAPLCQVGHTTGSTGERSIAMVQVMTDTAKQITTRGNTTSIGLRISTLGWIDQLTI